MKLIRYSLLFLPLTLFSQESSFLAEDLKSIGTKVWLNECRGTLEGLIHWDSQEEFPSLGIGHFIWYPEKTDKKFEETFPLLLEFFKQHEVKLPSWLAKSKGCPWRTRADFLKDARSQKMQQLRDILSDTLELQMKFIVKRFQEIETKITIELTSEQQQYLNQLKLSSTGIFALIDYAHFKGTGLALSERYRSQGWGLLQVLQEMPKELGEKNLLSEFTSAAKRVLAKRIKNAPQERHEERFLKGWYQRLETYQTK